MADTFREISENAKSPVSSMKQGLSFIINLLSWKADTLPRSISSRWIYYSHQ